VTVFSPNLDFWRKFFNCGKICKKMPKIGQNAKNKHIITHETSETKNNRNVEIGTNIAHGVRMMPELFVFKLCSALMHKNARNMLPFGEVK